MRGRKNEKKFLILLALPALLLSGCSKEISKEDAKKRAQEIADHEVKLDDFKKLHVEDTDDGSFEGNVNGTAKSKSVLEYSVEDKWVHSVTETEEKTGEIIKTIKQEKWVYQEEGNTMLPNIPKMVLKKKNSMLYIKKVILFGNLNKQPLKQNSLELNLVHSLP